MQKIRQALEANLERLWEVLDKWLEWQNAKCWVSEYHPGWVQIATKAKGKTTRQIYRDKIMKAYHGGCCNGKE